MKITTAHTVVEIGRESISEFRILFLFYFLAEQIDIHKCEAEAVCVL